MVTSVQVALLVLAALFVGIFIPVLFSLRNLMKKADKTLSHFDRELTTVLGRASDVLDRMDALGEGVQDGLPHLTKSLERVEKFSQSLEGLRKSVKTASMLGAAAAPAIAGAIQAIRAAAVKPKQGAQEDDDSADFVGAPWSPENLRPEDFIPEHLRQKESEDE